MENAGMPIKKFTSNNQRHKCQISHTVGTVRLKVMIS